MSQTIVITGANRGIGFAMTKICQQRGDTVYALCRQSSPQLNALGVNVIENVDIASDAGIAQAKSALSNCKIDLLINNAGILRDESLSQFNKETITEQFTVNALAPLAFTQALLSKFSTGSKIAFITSRMGSITDNTSGGRYGYFPLPHVKSCAKYWCYVTSKRFKLRANCRGYISSRLCTNGYG